MIWIGSSLIRQENQSPIKSTPKTLSSFPSLNLASLKQSSEEEKKEQIRRESSDFQLALEEKSGTCLFLFRQLSFFNQFIGKFRLLASTSVSFIVQFFSFLVHQLFETRFSSIKFIDSNEEILHSLINHYRIVTSLMTCICSIELSEYFYYTRKECNLYFDLTNQMIIKLHIQERTICYWWELNSSFLQSQSKL